MAEQYAADDNYLFHELSCFKKCLLKDIISFSLPR